MIVHVVEDIGQVGTVPRIRSLRRRSRHRQTEVPTVGHVDSWQDGAEPASRWGQLRANAVDLLVRLPRAVWAVTRSVRSARSRADHPVVVHAHQGPIAAFAAILGAMLSRAALVYEEHTLLEDYGGTERRRAVLRSAESWFAKLADACICQTPQAATAFAARTGVPLAKITVVPNGIDTDLFNRSNRSVDAESLRADLGLGDRPIVAYAGFLDSHYNAVDELLRAVRAVEQQVPTVSFVLAGTGPLEPTVAEFARAHSNTTFVGQLSQHEVATLYAAAEVVCVYRCRPSVATDTLVPQKLLEAMASEAVVVAAVKPAWEDLVDPSNAVVVTADSTLAEGIVEALTSATGRGAAGRARVTPMSWAASAAKLDGLYSVVARNRGRGGRSIG